MSYTTHGLLDGASLSDMLDEVRAYEVWNKGRIDPQRDPTGTLFRVDDYGDLIRWTDRNDRTSQFGWEMDHFPFPKALGGPDHAWNRRPLHWRNNAYLGGVLGNLLKND